MPLRHVSHLVFHGEKYGRNTEKVDGMIINV